MKQRSLKRYLALTTLTLLFSIYGSSVPGLAQNDTAPTESTGEEYLRKTGLISIDPITGQSYVIFEAVTNKVDTTGGVISKKGGRWYISPLCTFQIPAKLPKPIISGNQAIYSLKMAAFNMALLQDAASKINGSLNGFEIPLNKVQSFVGLMPIQKITFNPPEDLQLSIADIGKGTPGQKLTLSEDVIVELKVPLQNQNLFEDRVASTNGLPCTVNLVYNALNLKKQLVKFTGIDIQNTDSYRKLEQQGAAVVNAKQVQDMLMDVSRSKNWEQFEDPGMVNKLNDKSFDIFVKMINSTEEQKNIDAASATKMDEKIRNGTGLSADEFKPITLMRDVVSKIQDISDYNLANKVMNSEYEASKEKWDVSASAGWGPFSASVGYSKENQTAKSNFFSNNTELKQFQDKYVETKGPDAVFKMRGINLLETGKFQSKLTSLAEMVSFEPSIEPATLVIPSKLHVNTELAGKQFQFLPVGSIVAYGGDKDQLPENWAVCNGAEVESSKYPILAQKLNSLWGAAASGKVKLPDLRGYFLRGVDDGSGRDPDAQRTVGSVQSDSTKMPNSSFGTSLKGGHDHNVPTWTGVLGGNLEISTHQAGFPHAAALDYFPAIPTSRVEDHSHDITGGDVETRPKNADVFWIIKLK